ncbi:MAG: patatin-like phospholipase family protein [Cardiobacteriaceae bacterium]|nr:patatin-like phospholipase family protein [Cardiobacteriaceae bacterium]
MPVRRLKHLPALAAALMLSACSLVQYQPLETLDRIDTRQGYRLHNSLQQQSGDEAFIVLMISGGGSRAAALGYGVLEALARQPVHLGSRKRKLADSIDLVYGVSGGAVLAAYYSLHGADTIPRFEKHFLKQNFQRQVVRQVFSAANLPRLTSPEFGRGDLLEEQFETTLFGKATFGDLETSRKGPFAVISATDMSAGNRLDFTQEYFDAMCLDLSRLRLARAVAASSAVPIIFSPLTLNNHGGNCGYRLPQRILQTLDSDSGKLQEETRREFARNLSLYENSRERPYIHLLDGGLTDNLGLRSLLDLTEIYPENVLYRQFRQKHIRHIVIINVNAQNQMASDIDKSAAVPGLRDVVSALIDIPIDQHSLETLRRFRAVTDNWNATRHQQPGGTRAHMYFVSLNLRDLPPSPLRDKVLNIPTRFFLPPDDVNHLKQAAHLLLAQSGEYQRLLRALSAPPATIPFPVHASKTQNIEK